MEFCDYVNLIDINLLEIINQLRLEKLNVENVIGTKVDSFKCNEEEYSIFSLLPGIVGSQILVKYKNVIKYSENMKKIGNIYLVLGDFLFELPYKIGMKEIKNIRTYNSLSTRKSIDVRRKEFVLNYKSTLPSDLLNLLDTVNNAITSKDQLMPIYHEYYNFCLETEKIRQKMLNGKVKQIS